MIPVLNKKHGAAPAGSVYIGRPSQWGNPFAIGLDDRATVIDKYRRYIAVHPELVDQLRDENPTALVCWCAPLPCHGDVLAELLASGA